MVGAAVPEAAVEKDRDLSTGEDQVRRATQSGKRRKIHPVP
jgi:hypothetical protein